MLKTSGNTESSKQPGKSKIGICGNSRVRYDGSKLVRSKIDGSEIDGGEVDGNKVDGGKVDGGEIDSSEVGDNKVRKKFKKYVMSWSRDLPIT